MPNFSEGRDKSVIDQIVKAIAAVEGVKVLDVDPGEATNRTVVTFVGEPDAVLEGAFQGVKKSAEVIDMRKHHGAHPRSGGCDVLPLVPVSAGVREPLRRLRMLSPRRTKSCTTMPTSVSPTTVSLPTTSTLTTSPTSRTS